MPLIGSLTSGVSALKAFAKGMEVIGDNIANVNTTAFKGSRAQYSDDFADILQHSASSPSSGQRLGCHQHAGRRGRPRRQHQENFTQGSLNTTGEATDLAISGDGFFRVRDVQGGPTTRPAPAISALTIRAISPRPRATASRD